MQNKDIHTVTKVIMRIRLDSFRDVIERKDYKHAIWMLGVIKKDTDRGALDTWLNNKEYFHSILDELVIYCKEANSEKVLITTILLEQMIVD